MYYFNYYYEDALESAREFISKNPNYELSTNWKGHLNMTSLNDSCTFVYLDNTSNNLCWSGEVSAYIVRDKETYEDVAYFAGWCGKDDVNDE